MKGIAKLTLSDGKYRADILYDTSDEPEFVHIVTFIGEPAITMDTATERFTNRFPKLKLLPPIDFDSAVTLRKAKASSQET